jgi:hypothetical protein
VAGRVRFAYGVGELRDRSSTEKLPPNAELLVTDRPSIPLGDERVSVAFSDNLVGRLGPFELMRHLREVHRVLVPGGVYVCRTTRPSRVVHDPSPGADQRALKSHSFEELTGRLAAADFWLFGTRSSFGRWSLASPPWLPAAVEWLIERVPFRVRRWLGRSSAVSSMLGAITIVAWKDDLGWHTSRSPTHLGLRSG